MTDNEPEPNQFIVYATENSLTTNGAGQDKDEAKARVGKWHSRLDTGDNSLHFFEDCDVLHHHPDATRIIPLVKDLADESLLRPSYCKHCKKRWGMMNGYAWRMEDV